MLRRIAERGVAFSRPSTFGSVAPAARALHTSAAALGGGGHGREYLKPRGTRVKDKDGAFSYEYHHFTDIDHAYRGPTSKYVKERGRVYTKPVIQDDQRNALDIVFGAESPHIPNQYWRRQKQIQWGNAAWQNKTEYIFFYIPTYIVVSLCLPGFALLYGYEDCNSTDMVIKVTGRQWYWLYEIESPTDDDDEEEEDD